MLLRLRLPIRPAEAGIGQSARIPEGVGDNSFPVEGPHQRPRGRGPVLPMLAPLSSGIGPVRCECANVRSDAREAQRQGRYLVFECPGVLGILERRRVVDRASRRGRTGPRSVPAPAMRLWLRRRPIRRQTHRSTAPIRASSRATTGGAPADVRLSADQRQGHRRLQRQPLHDRLQPERRLDGVAPVLAHAVRAGNTRRHVAKETARAPDALEARHHGGD
jgi:hypothetical protein